MTKKFKTCGTAVEGFFSGEAHEVGIIVFLGYVSQDQITSMAVKTFRVAEILTDSVIGKMAGAAQYALFYDPGIRANFQHVEVVIGFKQQTIGVAQMNFDKLGHVAEIGNQRHLGALTAKCEADGVDGIMRNRESVHFYIANHKTLAGMYGFYARDAFAKRFWQAASQRIQSRFSNVQRSFPEGKHLRQTVAVISMFVGNKDAVEMVDGHFDGSEARESFAFAQTGVNQESGALCLE